MAATDNLFSCAETPVWTPATFNPTTLAPCLSCILRLSSQLPGPGSIQASTFGFTVDENPTTVLTINGMQHSLIAAELVVPGLHRLYGAQTVADAEYVLTFRNTNDTSKVVLFCIPIVIGTGHGNGYFTNLGIINRGRPVLSSLVAPDTGVLTYPGASIFGRNTTICNSLSNPVTYYVTLKPSYITSVEYQRLHSQLKKTHVNGPKPTTEITQTRALALLTYINTIKLEGPLDKKGKKEGETDDMNTKALKCYRIDPLKDIKGDKVIIGGATSTNSLYNELQTAATADAQLPDSGSIKPGDIESIVSIILGILLSIVLCSAIMYFIWKGTFSEYVAGLKLYTSTVPIKNPT